MTEQDAAQTVVDALTRTLDAQGPARLIKLKHAHDLVCAAIDEHAAAEQARSAARGPSHRRLAFVLVLATVAAGAAAAVFWLALFWRGQTATIHQPESGLAAASALQSAAPPDHSAHSDPASPSATLGLASAPGIDSTNEPPVSANAAGSADAPTLAAPAASDDEADPHFIETLLEHASAVRRRGKLSEAERTYLRVIRLDSESIPAYVAMTAVGSLRQAKDPAGALDVYRRAREIRPNGPLEVEILSGMARAYQRLGNAAGETRVLREVVRAYPQDAAAEAARKRLRKLRARP
jgi:tetratricopeptide (TPR) repeat protein